VTRLIRPLGRRRPGARDRAGAGDHVAGLGVADRVSVEVGAEGRVEALDHVAEADRQRDVHDLLWRLMPCQRAVGLVVDRLEPRRLARVGDDRRLRRCIQALGWRIVGQPRHLLFRQSYAPTAHRVSGNSIVAVVDHCGREVGELGIPGLERRARPVDDADQLAERSSGLRPVGQRAIQVEHLAARLAGLLEEGAAVIGQRGIVFMQEWDADLGATLGAVTRQVTAARTRKRGARHSPFCITAFSRCTASHSSTCDR